MAIAAGLHMDARRMFHGLALDWEAEKFMQFVADVKAADDGALQIMYGIDREPPESTRDDLSGYASARPVRMGNAAFNQRQNDIFGAVLDAILLRTRRKKRLLRRLWSIVESQATCAALALIEPVGRMIMLERLADL